MNKKITIEDLREPYEEKSYEEEHLYWRVD